MPRDYITKQDRKYVELVYPTRYHALAFIGVLVIAGILCFIFAYFWRIVVPNLVPVNICAGIVFLFMAYLIRWDYEDRGYRLFPKDEDPKIRKKYVQGQSYKTTRPKDIKKKL